jgi:ABC-2 type transport system permease protein
LFGSIGIAFIIGDYYFFHRIFIYLKSVPFNVGELLIVQLFSVINLTFLSMLLFSNVVVSLSTIYLSRDLYLLLSSPIDLTTIFISKFFQTLLNSSYMVLLFGIPIYIAYGVVYRADFFYYLFTLIILIPFLFIPAGIGILITMVLMRYFPAKKTHQVLTFLGLTFSAVIVMFLRFLRPERFYQEVSDNALLGFLDSLKAPDLPLMPSSWLTSSLGSLMGGDHKEYLIYLAMMVLSAIFIFLLSVYVSTKIYFMGWQGAKETKNISLKPKDSKITSFIWRIIPHFFNNTQKAFLKKDIKIFFRDSTQWSQIFILTALIIVYLFNVKNLPIQSEAVKNLISFLNLGLAGFIVAAVAIRFVFPTTSLESGCIWLIACAPVDYKSFLIEKFFLFLFPLLLIAEVLIYFSNVLLGVDTFMMVLGLVTMFFITIAITALGVGMGAMYPKFNFKSSAEIASSTGGVLYMILSLTYIGVVIVLEAYPVYSYFNEKLWWGAFDVKGALVFFSISFAITVAVIILPLRFGISSLKRMEF